MSERSTQRKGVIQYAATPILVRDIEGKEEFNKKLCDLILAARDKAPMGEPRTNRGGWQSPDTFLETLPPEFRNPLAEMVWGCICEIVRPARPNIQSYNFRLKGWANVNAQGGFNMPHQHPNGIWSAVYYLAGDENAGGEIHFLDPRPQASVIMNPLTPWGGELIYKPENSSLIVFPSWLVHFVMPYNGQAMRINVAFNGA